MIINRNIFLKCKKRKKYFSEVKHFVRIIEGRELSGAAVQVDKTRTKRWQETETVIHCNDTKWPPGFKTKRDPMSDDEKDEKGWHKWQNIRECSRIKKISHENKVKIV